MARHAYTSRYAQPVALDYTGRTHLPVRQDVFSIGAHEAYTARFAQPVALDYTGRTHLPVRQDLYSIGGFFSCDVPLDAVHQARMPVFPGQRNHWLVMTSVKPGLSSQEQTKRVLFDVQNMLASTKGDKVESGGILKKNSFPVHPNRLKQLRIGPKFVIGPPPFLLNARQGNPNIIAQLAPDGVTGGGVPGRKLYRNTLFTPVSFVYTPDIPHTSVPWVWRKAIGIRDCANGGYGVAAVFKPTPLSQAELEKAKNEPSTPFEEIGDHITKTTKALLWGGAAVLLFQLYNATKTR